MSVPPLYNTVAEYFEDVLDFLKTYHWVYSCPNTHILVNKVLDQFPVEWPPYLQNLVDEEFNDLLVGNLPKNAPDSLKQFIQKISKTRSTVQKIPTENIDYKFLNNSGLSDKKKHEITSFAPLIHKMCNETGCKYIIDVGTGLGYLPHLLFEKYKYSTLGIEGNSEKIKLAKINQRKYPESLGSVNYVQHFVTDQSEEFMKEMAKQNSINNVCITGLHACADLSITILNLFTKLDFVKVLLIMPCCYHRLKQSGDGFENFPASNLLKELLQKTGTAKFLKVPFLRLACQRAGDDAMTQTARKEQASSCLFRAILQEVAESENYQVRRLKRKSGKLSQKGDVTDPFEAYLDRLKHTHTLIGGNICGDEFLEKMREKWTRHKGNAYLIEALTAFQAAIQNVCETVVLLDRVMFLTEKGIKCFVVKVTDQGISPRCHALIAVKP